VGHHPVRPQAAPARPARHPRRSSRTKDIHLTKTLADADEHDLLIRYGQLAGLRDAGHMTRAVETECHNQILYAATQRSED
jgi:hypothetical protein